MWRSLLSTFGFASWVAVQYYTNASYINPSINPDHLVANTVIFAAAGGLLGWLLWRFVFCSSMGLWLKMGIAFVAVGFPYYFFHSSPGNTMFSVLLYCLPVGAIFGAILAALGVGRRSSTARDSNQDRTTQKLEQQRYAERRD